MGRDLLNYSWPTQGVVGARSSVMAAGSWGRARPEASVSQAPWKYSAGAAIAEFEALAQLAALDCPHRGLFLRAKAKKSGGSFCAKLEHDDGITPRLLVKKNLTGKFRKP
jgi:hypothetical protein